MVFHRRSMGGRTTAPLWRVTHTPESQGLSWTFFFSALALILIASGAGFFYIRQTITTATSGYGISVLERRAEDLRKEEAGLRFEVAEFQSLQRIHDQIVKLNLVPVGSPVYTTPVLDAIVTGQIPVGFNRQ